MLIFYKSVHDPIPTLPVGIGNTLEIFKTNQQALLSTECPGIFSSWKNLTGEEDHFWRQQEQRPHCQIAPNSTWLSKEM